MIKRIFSFFLFYLLEIYLFLTSKDDLNFENIIIPLYPTIGIGDLIMLSPAIEKMAQLYPNKKIYIVSHLPQFISFSSDIFFIKLDEEKSISSNSLLVSFTLNIKHSKLLLKYKLCLGYFSKSRLQSNIKGLNKSSYNGQVDHYLERAISVIKLLNSKGGQELENEFKLQVIKYPKIQEETFSLIDEIEGKNLILGLFPQFDHSLWALNKAAEVINSLYHQGLIENIIILGDESDRNKSFSYDLMNDLKIPKEFIYNFTGKTNLKQVAYCIRKSAYFFGIDSGLSHIAYLSTKPVLSIFIIAKAINILPQNKDLLKNINTISAYSENELQLFNGFNPVNKVQAKIKSEYIEGSQVILLAKKMMTKE